MVIRVAEVMEPQASAPAFLMLRNLAHSRETQPHFAANPRILPLLLTALESRASIGMGSKGSVLIIAASTLLSLLYHGEKVSTTLSDVLETQIYITDNLPSKHLFPFQQFGCNSRLWACLRTATWGAGAGTYTLSQSSLDLGRVAF